MRLLLHFMMSAILGWIVILATDGLAPSVKEINDTLETIDTIERADRQQEYKRLLDAESLSTPYASVKPFSDSLLLSSLPLFTHSTTLLNNLAKSASTKDMSFFRGRHAFGKARFASFTSSSSSSYDYAPWRKGVAKRVGIPSAVSTLGAMGLFSTSGNATEKASKQRYPWHISASVFSAPKTVASLRGREGRAIEIDDCGEDAAVIVENNYQVVMAVADGVGGWRDKGVDPSGFSRSLIRHLEAIVMGVAESSQSIANRFKWAMSNNQPQQQDPRSRHDGSLPIPAYALLGNAFWRLCRGWMRGEEKPFGSSTICVVSLDRRTGELDTANLGDSGYLVVRQGSVLARSQSQQHRFNAPYQLTLAPDGNISDTSKMAASDAIPLHAGDIVVVASDGLWDNLFEDDVLEILGADKQPREMAIDLVKRARELSEDDKYASPFSVEAAKHGRRRLGGKEDDITVVVGIIQYDDSAS